MDLSAILIGITVVIAIVLPLALIIRSQKNKQRAMLIAINDAAQRSANQISLYDLWHDTAIGIDQSANVIFFARKTENLIETQQIDLSQITQCRTINQSRTLREEKSSRQIIERLALVFLFHNRKEQECTFFDIEENHSVLHRELEFINKWQGIVNAHIDKLTSSKK